MTDKIKDRQTPFDLWFKNILSTFWFKRWWPKNVKYTGIESGFNDEQIIALRDNGLTVAAKVLTSVMIITGKDELLTGTVEYPDGSKYVITFEKIAPPTTKGAQG